MDRVTQAPRGRRGSSELPGPIVEEGEEEGGSTPVKQPIVGGEGVLSAPLSRHEVSANLSGLLLGGDGTPARGDRYAALEYARRMDQASTVEERRHAAGWLEDKLGVRQVVHPDGSLGAMRAKASPPASFAARVRAAADL